MSRAWARTHHAGELGEAVIGVAQTQAGGGNAELRIRGGEAHIGGQGGRQAAADAVSLDEPDQGFGESGEGVIGAARHPIVGVLLGRVGPLAVELGDVRTRHERLAAGAAHDDHPHLIVFGKGPEDVGDALPHLQRQRVVARRMVENHPADACIAVGQHTFGVQWQRFQKPSPPRSGRCAERTSMMDENARLAAVHRPDEA